MFPLQDMNPTRRLPIITYALIAINALVFFWQISLPPEELQRVFLDIAAVPRNLSAAPFSAESIADTFRSMFLHGGWDHILGNMLYLWLFGDNVEDRFGAILYLVLYFLGGIAATVAQTIIDPNSPIPMVGASGAIAAVLGSYLILYPNVRVRGIIPLGRISSLQELPAWIVLGMWFGLQLIQGFGSLGVASEYGGGVAFFAHIGGFVAGVVITLIFNGLVPQPPVPERNEVLYERARRYVA